jgi:selenium-binding protein 1
MALLTTIGLGTGAFERLGGQPASALEGKPEGRSPEREAGGRGGKGREGTLLVWAGDQAHAAPDFVAVVDFDARSPSYGRVLRTVPLPRSLPTSIAGGSGAIGNEPHHVGLSADGRTFVGGGLLSVLRGQSQAFFFDVSTPRSPRFIRADNPPDASIADEFEPLSNGGFLVTFMGGASGSQPGRVVEYDAHAKFVQSWPESPPTDGQFNPHGIAVDEAHNLIVTSDFICPAHTLIIPGGATAQFRGSVRIWDLARREITKTVIVGDPAHPPGTINVELIPHDRKLRAFVDGVLDGKLYLIDTQKGTSREVFDFTGPFALPDAPNVWPHLFKINQAGTRLFVTLNYAGANGRVVLLDIANPARPRLLDSVSLGKGSGPHYITLDEDEDRVVVSDYFLVEDLPPGGVVGVDGDHKIHVIRVEDDRLVLDERFDLDFNRDIATGPARPHGLAVLGGRHRGTGDRE